MIINRLFDNLFLCITNFYHPIFLTTYLATNLYILITYVIRIGRSQTQQLYMDLDPALEADPGSLGSRVLGISPRF
jgi:hypothetical protein